MIPKELINRRANRHREDLCNNFCKENSTHGICRVLECSKYN